MKIFTSFEGSEFNTFGALSGSGLGGLYPADEKCTASPGEDLKKVLSAFEVKDLKRLLSARRNGKLIRHSFYDGGGRGCVMNRLDPHIHSFDQIDEHPSMDELTREAAHRLVMAWDANELSARQLERIVLAELKARQEANAAEEAAIKRVSAKLGKRSKTASLQTGSKKSVALNCS